MSYTFWLLKGRTLLRQKLYVKGGMHDERSYPSYDISYKFLLPVFKRWEVYRCYLSCRDEYLMLTVGFNTGAIPDK